MASHAMKITLERIALFQFTPAHCAQARAMLGWSVDELSRESGVSVEAISDSRPSAMCWMSPGWRWRIGLRRRGWCFSRGLRRGEG